VAVVWQGGLVETAARKSARRADPDNRGEP